MDQFPGRWLGQGSCSQFEQVARQEGKQPGHEHLLNPDIQAQPRQAKHINDDFSGQEDQQRALPAPIPPDVYEECRKLSLAAHKALGCRGVSRADFRYDETRGRAGIFCLEVNTQPGMTETSLVPEMAAHAGISFEQLVAWMVEDASLDR